MSIQGLKIVHTHDLYCAKCGKNITFKFVDTKGEKYGSINLGSGEVDELLNLENLMEWPERVVRHAQCLEA